MGSIRSLLFAAPGVALVACNFIMVTDYPSGRGWWGTGGGETSEGGGGGQGAQGGSGEWPAVCNGTCHGGTYGNPAPPLGAHGETATADPTVGAHQQHYGPSNWHRSVDCTECHTLPSSTECPDPQGKDPTHCNNQIDLNWGPLARLEVASPPTYDAQTTYQCANTYCHGASLDPDVGPATNRAPIWTTVDGTQDACGTTCHSNPPGGTHSALLDCHSCHAAVIATFTAGPPAQATWVDAEKHINGINESNLPL